MTGPPLVAEIRKIQRVGTGKVITIPVDVARRWETAGARHVLIRRFEDHLELWPLTAEELIQYPVPEEEPPTHGPLR